MFSGLLNPGGQSRSRSKSPGARPRESNGHHSTTTDDDRDYHRTSRSKYDESDSEDEAPTRRGYVDRTPDDYTTRSNKDDRRRSRRDEDYGYSKKPSKKYNEEDVKAGRGRRERDQYAEYAETPKSARPSSAVYKDSESLQYAAFQGNGSIPGGFPGQSVKPPPESRPSRAGPNQYAAVNGVQYAKIDPSEVQYKYNSNNSSRQPSYSKAYDAVPTQPPKAPKSRPKVDSSDSEGQFKDFAEAGRRQSYHRERSPVPSPRNSTSNNAEQLRKSLGRLSTSSVAGGMLGVAGTPATAGGKPPSSPLLEAYKGTYQSISPLPSPLALQARGRDDENLSDLDLSEEGDSEDELNKKIKALKKEKERVNKLKTGRDSQDLISPRSSGSKLEAPRKKSRTTSNASATSSALAVKSKAKKAVSFYDPEVDAEKIADALRGSHRAPDLRPLLKIMPWLTTDEIIHLKNAYKNHAKINGQGINLSKHIKARIPGNIGKILYATSLGQYESDAYWANCFYQSGASRRELLIESLVGRTNQQIREIKDVFKDKRYDDDLEKCMKAELKADKFRYAILLALEERRMPEGLGLDMRLVHEDGVDLYDALTSAGGETAMIKIVMVRSNDHLREVMRYYEKSYRRNFARDMISKSQNLVGETLAHVLNGALNRAMRDAILLHQAIEEFATANSRTPSPNTKPAAGRAELLISRIVRLHWEAKHLERVKDEYYDRYGESVVRAMARDVQGNMKTEEGKAWAGFAIDLVRSSET